MPPTKKMTPAQEAELTVRQKYEILQTVLHPRMQHIDKVYVTEDGKYYFSKGHKLTVSQPLDADKDAKKIAQTGKRHALIELPGEYINRKKVVDEIPVENFTDEDEKKEIVDNYAELLKKEELEAKKNKASDIDATVEFLVEKLKGSDKKD